MMSHKVVNRVTYESARFFIPTCTVLIKLEDISLEINGLMAQVWAYIDGKRTSLEIAMDLGVDFYKVDQALKYMKDKKIVEY